MKMEEALGKKVFGQIDAIKEISSSVRRARIGLSLKNRPMGSFIFLGPTGVGKTELAKRLAEFIFGDLDALIRIDMSEFMEKHNVSRLIGAPPGYIGYEEGGLLTEKIRRKPYSVILLDEIEKAHPDVFNILLQVLEEGQLTDHLGHTVSFRDAIIIMTSNVGAREIMHDNNIGFSSKDKKHAFKEMKTSLLNELKRVFNPEFLNRIDEIIVFHQLEQEDLFHIVDIMFEEIKESIKDHNISVIINNLAKDFIVSNYYDKKYGARTLRRALQKEVADKLTNEILSGSFKKNDNIEITVKNNQIEFIVKSDIAKIKKKRSGKKTATKL
jgi:ATP-dependent Clp protease ATP-binding subunit ClpC